MGAEIVEAILAKSTASLHVRDGTDGMSVDFPVSSEAIYSRHIVGNTPLHVACSIGNLPLVTVLLSFGAKFDVADNAGLLPLHRALLKDHVDVVASLTSTVPATLVLPSTHNQSPLSIAAGAGAIRCMQLLMSHHPVLDTHDEWGQTPLLCACKSGHGACVSLLVEHGADVNAEDHQGMTPLLVTVLARHAGLVGLLARSDRLRLDARRPGTQETALHIAARAGDAASVAALLSAGAEVMTVDAAGANCLQVADASVAPLLERRAVEISAARAQSSATMAAQS